MHRGRWWRIQPVFSPPAARVVRVAAVEGFALLLKFRCADNDLVRLFSKQQVVIEYSATTEDFLRSIDAAENGPVRKHRLFTEFDAELDKLVKSKAALRSDLTEIGE